jgi:hypothetical protein
VNKPLARIAYAALAIGAGLFGLSWVKYELVDDPYPHDAWVAAIWLASAAVLGWAALAGVGRGMAMRAATFVAATASIVLVAALAITASHLS